MSVDLRQIRSSQPDISSPLPSDYLYPEDALVAAVWHSSGNGQLATVKQLCRVEHVRKVIPPGSGDAATFASLLERHALAAAAKCGQLEIFEYLHSSGCRPSTVDVAYAAEYGHTEIIAFCVENEVDLARLDNYKLLTAAFRHEGILDMFLAQGVDPDAGVENFRDHSKGVDGNGYFRNEGRRSALEEAARRSTLSVVRKLVEHGADPTLGNPLHEAVTRPLRGLDPTETEAIIEYLISKGCDVNQYDDLSWKKSVGRPLHWAAYWNANTPYCQDMIKILLKNDADPGGRNDGGYTPLDILRAYTDMPEMAELLGHKLGDFQGPETSRMYAKNWFQPVSWPRGEEEQEKVARSWSEKIPPEETTSSAEDRVSQEHVKQSTVTLFLRRVLGR